MNIAIFGSCVSRDTAEFIPDAEVVTYIARQSVTSLESPHGANGINVAGLDSAFQRRMVLSDLKGNGLKRIVKNSRHIDLVLIDLVDERRGFWLFSDGSTMTNSLEIESSGAARAVRRDGARLVEFGTDEHFDTWVTGLDKLMVGLEEAGLREKTLFLDIEWASAVDGAQHAQNDGIAKLGRKWRKLQRGTRDAGRVLSRGRSLGDAWASLRTVKPTEAEDYADRASAANANYVRYRREAESKAAHTITRSSKEVRIDRSHKWGPQPFHYREADYLSIVDSILEHMKLDRR